jgi:hypothetical protein
VSWLFISFACILIGLVILLLIVLRVPCLGIGGSHL